MTDLTFWSTMGQVSATFVGLAFVGLSIYLGGIRSAITEVHLKYPLQENSSRFVYVAMWSNLSLFVLPLLTSLSLILKHEHSLNEPAFLCFVSGILTLVFVLNFSLYLSKATRRCFDLLRTEAHTLRKLLRFRIVLGGWGLSATIIVYGALLFVMQMPTTSLWATALLKGVSLLSIIVGLCLGVFDLVAFDTDNVLFKVSEDFRRKTEDRERTLKTRMARIDYIFTRWRGLVCNPQLVDRMYQVGNAAGVDTQTIEKQICETWERKVTDYNDFKVAILRAVNPTTGRYRFAERVLADSKVITLKELREMGEEVERLLEATTSFLKYLSEDYERWEKRRRECGL